MKFVFTPNPYLHKELVVAHEAGVLARMTFERQAPFEDDTNIWKYNPIGKITALELDDGTSIFGGLLVCEYLDSFNTRAPLFPRSGADRWKALRLMMLGDGLFNANAALRVEIWYDEDQRRRDYMLRERRKIHSALTTLEREIGDWSERPFHIGHVCIAGALSYIDLRNTVAQLALEKGDAAFDWRRVHAGLAAWYDTVSLRPSIQFSPDALRDSPVARSQLARQNDPAWERNGTTIGPGLV